MSIASIPPPAADFTYVPGDASTFDDVAFSYWNGGYWDPSVSSWGWNFGDGTTATGQTVSHRYATDGDYTVTLTVSADGGRSNTAAHSIQIRTHDVAILSLGAPTKGKVGKPARFTVGVGNSRYPEIVRVDLYKVTPQGDTLVGTRTQSVGVLKLKTTALHVRLHLHQRRPHAREAALRGDRHGSGSRRVRAITSQPRPPFRSPSSSTLDFALEARFGESRAHQRRNKRRRPIGSSSAVSAGKRAGSPRLHSCQEPA